MQLTFTSELAGERKVRLDYPPEFAGAGHFDERETELLCTWGTLKLTELWFDGICICLTEFDHKQQCTVNMHCDNFCWIMNFVLEGDLTARLENTRAITLHHGKYHTFYAPAIHADVVLEQSAKIFTICLTRKFISKLVGKDILNGAFDTNTQAAFTLITKGNYRHTRLQAIVEEIMGAQQPGYIRRIFLESKILELLSVQLHQLENKQTSPNGFNREDIARLQEAKVIIAQNIQTPCSLIELARKTGLNDFKLKKGFKALFGHTVFGYLFELRMNTAYNLLQNDKSVSEVAEIIGYKNPHHFTAAFKKKFGFLPSQVSRMAV